MIENILGNKNSFAIQYEITEVYENFIYGKLCYWIDNMQIGEYDEGVTISDLFWNIQDLVRDNGKRVHNELFQLELEELFQRLNSTLFGNGNEQYNEISELEIWARFNIGLNVDIFRGYKVFLVESENKARIISSDKKGIINQYYIEKGVVDKLFIKFFNELNKVYENYI